MPDPYVEEPWITHVTEFPQLGHRVTLKEAFEYETVNGRRVLPAGLVLAQGMGRAPRLREHAEKGGPGMILDGWLFSTQVGHPVIPRSKLLIEELMIGVTAAHEDQFDAARRHVEFRDRAFEDAKRFALAARKSPEHRAFLLVCARGALSGALIHHQELKGIDGWRTV